VAVPVVHVEVRGLDEPTLRAFYLDIFGWVRIENLSVDGYSIFSVGNPQLTATTGPTPDETAAGQ
jgi:hypothetical protein